MRALKRLSPPAWAALAMLLLALLAPLARHPPAPASSPPPSPTLPAATDLAARQAALTAVLATEPLNPAAHFELGLLLALSQPNEAHRHLQTAADLAPAYQQPAIAVRNALALAQQHPDPAYAAILIGQALAAQAEWPAAAAAFQRSADLAPDYPEAWAFLAEAQQQLGQDATPALETALTLGPQSLAVHLVAAQYWQRQNDPAQARQHLETANTLSPDTPAILTDLAHTIAALGEVQAGLEHLLRVTELTPERLAAWQTLAELSLNYNIQVEQFGLPAARQAVLMAGEDPAALTLMGRAYALLENPLQAERFYQRALAAGPDYAPAHLHYALLHIAAGRPPAARPLLQRALELASPADPTGQQAAAALQTYFPQESTP